MSILKLILLFYHRIAKKRRKKQGLAKVWDFLYRWVGGGFSMKNYHPSAKPGAAPQKTVATTLEVDSLLDLTRHVVDPLLSKPQKKAGPGTTGSKWGKVADKVNCLRLVFRQPVTIWDLIHELLDVHKIELAVCMERDSVWSPLL